MTASVIFALVFALPSAPPAGPPPYLMELRSDDHGRVMLRVFRTEMKKVVRFNIERDQNGESVFREVEVEEPRSRLMVVELQQLKDLKAFTASGKQLTPKEAVERIGPGAMVVVSADGDKVDAAYTRIFKDDAIVLCSPDLVPKAYESLQEPAVVTPGK